jgi:hypothetical protein
MVLNSSNSNLSFGMILTAIYWSVLLPSAVADTSSEKRCCLKVGLVALNAVETAWIKTKEFKSAMQNAHDVRQQINHLVPAHSSSCIFEAPVGSYESVCDSCKSLAKNTLEKLNKLEGQEGLQLRRAKTIRLGAINKAAEWVRRRENLDILVDREAGIVAGFKNLVESQTDKGMAITVCTDYTEEVLQAVKQAQSPVQQHPDPSGGSKRKPRKD